jgi:UDP-N-acetylglucosamine acyltransferase
MVGGMSGVEHDVIPFGLVMGERAALKGLNVVGLKRDGFSRDEIQSLQSAYDRIFATGGTVMERLKETESHVDEYESVRELLGFIRSDSARALCKPKP